MVTARQIQEWMELLCADPNGRSVGTAVNRQASELFIAVAKACGAQVRMEEFDCLDFEPGEVELSCGDISFPALASPFSHPCDLEAELVEASTTEQLYGMDIAGKLLLLHGEIAAGQIMPKNFVFYNPEEHQRLVRYLESSGVAAVISASPPMPELNAAVYPCPMFEDGDLQFPSVYMSQEEGEHLLTWVGKSLRLRSSARRIPARAIHAVAEYGPPDGRTILLCAHLDSKPNTTGAADNAGSTAITLALLYLLRDYNGPCRVQILPFNGEDYYAVPGEMLYMRDWDPARMELCLNMDSVGVKGCRTGYCHFNATPALRQLIGACFGAPEQYAEIEPWYQGDHSIFAMQGIPTIALSTEDLSAFFHEYAHTEKDTADKMDSAKLLTVAESIAGLVRKYKS